MFEIRNLQPHSRQAHTKPMAALLDSGGASAQKPGGLVLKGLLLALPLSSPATAAGSQQAPSTGTAQGFVRVAKWSPWPA